MRQGFASCLRVTEIYETRGEFRAIEEGLRRLRPGDLILVQADQVEPSLAFIQEFIAANARTGEISQNGACNGAPRADYLAAPLAAESGSSVNDSSASSDSVPVSATALAGK
jgi:hypothetical protein